MPQVSLRIENHYATGTIVTTTRTSVPSPVPSGEVEREDWAQDYLFPYTGTGRSGDAIYDVTITASDEPSLTGLTFTFGG